MDSYLFDSDASLEGVPAPASWRHARRNWVAGLKPAASAACIALCLCALQLAQMMVARGGAQPAQHGA
ncbi:MAG: hypothetical protein ACYCZ6_13825 [Polaromonas sp.]